MWIKVGLFAMILVGGSTLHMQGESAPQKLTEKPCDLILPPMPVQCEYVPASSGLTKIHCFDDRGNDFEVFIPSKEV